MSITEVGLSSDENVTADEFVDSKRDTYGGLGIILQHGCRSENRTLRRSLRPDR